MVKHTGGMDSIRGEPLIYSEGLYSVEFNVGLTEWEIEDAKRLLKWIKGSGPFFGVSGTMIVSGPRRQGKGLFANVLAWKIKRYFKGKKILRDDHAPPLFGPYTLFNEDTMLGEIAAMSEVAEATSDGNGTKKKGKLTAKASLSMKLNEWRTPTGRGGLLIQNSVILKDEFWKDMNKRRPSSAMNLLFGGLLRTCYHIDTLVVGVVQRADDLDRFTCMPFVNIQVKCTWCDPKVRPNTTRVAMHHVEWSAAQQRLIVHAKAPLIIYLNGGLPRPELGGKSYFDLFYSKNAPNMQGLIAQRR